MATLAPDVRHALGLRSRRLNKRRVVSRGRDYVFCWLMQALRADDNPAVDAAIAIGNDKGLPVVVFHGLENRYPYASHRLHRFILEASRTLEADAQARGLRFVRWMRRPGDDNPGLRLAQRAAAVVVDDMSTFVVREYADYLARTLERPVFAVDACCSVPLNAFAEPLRTTKGFRAAHTKLRPHHLGLDLRQEIEVPVFDGDLDLEHQALPEGSLDALIESTGVDMSVPPAPEFVGGRDAALERLAFAVREVVPRYQWTRNNPALENGTSKISPWMHFGVLSPREVANAVLAAEAAGNVHSAARWKFLDETLTWREYYHHRCRVDAAYGRWQGLPTWARETLLDHAEDPRPSLYSLEELAHGETDDETWNAAQKQFLIDGFMNNNLRMYWAKQVVRWRQDPREAWATACYLNDRFSLDGRDPSTYGGVRWGFGDARPGSREIAVYGKVAAKTSGALRKRAGVPEWLAEQAAREPHSRAASIEDEKKLLERYC